MKQTLMAHPHCFRHIILLLSLLATTITTSARGFDPLNSSFISLRSGLVTYANDTYTLLSSPNYHASISVGHWALSSLGIGVTFSEIHSKNKDDITSFYECLGIDILALPLRFSSTQVKERNRDLMMKAGFGIVHRKENALLQADNDFFASLGIDFEQRIYNSFFLSIEALCQFYTRDFDNNKSMSMMFMPAVGLTYKVKYNPFRIRSSGETQRMREDWHIVGCGEGGAMIGKSGISPVAGLNIAVGKYLSTQWETRLRASGGACITNIDNLTYTSLTLDVLLNLSNLRSEMRNRKFNLSLYGGAGVIDNQTTERNMLFTVEGGFSARIWLTTQSDLVFDLRGLLFPPRLSSMGAPIMGTFGVGYVYNIGRNTCR